VPFYLDHTVVPSHDKEASARFFARIFGLEYKGPWGPFAPVKVNETLSMDFDDRRSRFDPMHYAFITSEEEFDTVLERVKQEGIAFGSGPGSSEDGEINHLYGGRGFYFKDPNGHLLEVITHTYV
jgi:catechol 2,3-dioxygenase-like lactoylglutathione lyase family enzyme